jgi:ATP/maltotriose-dependent transcriptional regulator MalT
VSGEVGALLEAAAEARQAGEWGTVRASLEAALALEESAEVLLALGDALWWLGETGDSVRRLEAAYAAFRRRPQPDQAALAAISLYFLYRVSLGNRAASRGWLARVTRLVGEFELVPLEGWVLLMRAHDVDDPAAAEGLARAAREAARRFGDADLELCALSQAGTALVEMGRIEEGLALLDEAMAGSLGGEGQSLDTVVYTSCNMITCCSRAAQFQRAAEWIRAADDFTRRYGSPHLYTLCRTHYGSVLFSTGRWAEAETELGAALAMSSAAEPHLHAEALIRLAELRLAQGRIEEAERLVAGHEGHVESVGVLGAIHLLRGEPAVAASVLGRRLREIGEERLESVALLELLAEAEIAQGAAAAAVARGERLAALGMSLGCEVAIARGERVRGRALGAVDDGDAALVHLERALAAFARLELPLEVARTRLLLARSLGAGRPEAAIAEGRAALAAFEGLGAARDADEAAALLRSLGVRAARAGPRGLGLLSKRELEVLGLLAHGRSNRDIAEQLFLTRKTVEHHVHNVLVKLEVANRAEAAAYAVRHLERGPTGG